VLGKVRPTTHRENGSESEPDTGLSDGRLALVHRYMIDAEEAEAQASAAAGADEEHPRARVLPNAAARVAAEAEERRETTRPSLDPRQARLRHEAWAASRATLEPEPVRGADRVARYVSEIPEAPRPEWHSAAPSPHAGQSRRTWRAVAREEKRAAKQAAQVLAALEKHEARERKALAKAAARRRPNGISRT
jgi:fused signal recognition particle receptor